MAKSGGDTKTEVRPWEPTKAPLVDVINKSGDLYNSGGPGPYQGQTYAGLNTAQRDSLGNIIHMGNGPAPAVSAGNAAITQIAGGIQNPGSNAALAKMAGGGTVNPATGLLTSLSSTDSYNNYIKSAGQLKGPDAGAGIAIDPAQAALARASGANAAAGFMTNTASGAYLNNNPTLDNEFKRQAGAVTDDYLKSVMPSFESRLSMSGNSDSETSRLLRDDAQKGLAEKLTGLSSDIYYQDYSHERGLQEQAAANLGQLDLGQQASQQNAVGLLGSLGQQRDASRLAANNSQAQIQSQQNSDRLQALGLRSSNFNTQQQQQLAALGLTSDNANTEVQQRIQAAGLAPGLDAARYSGSSAALAAGGQIQANSQGQMQDSYQRYLDAYQGPFSQQGQLQNYLNSYLLPISGTGRQTVGGGAAGGGGAGPIVGGLTGGLSGAAAGGAIGGALAGGAAGSVIPGWGTAIGAGIGLIGGIYGSS